MASSGQCVAAITRRRTGCGRVAPIGSTSRSASTRSSRACSARGMSPISSRKSVPPSASWIRPRLPFGPAPEKLPGRWPNSSLSISDSGMAAQLTATKGPSRRALLRCSALARNSLPLPVSPVISRLTGLSTSRAARSTSRSSAGSPPESAASGAGSVALRGVSAGRRAGDTAGGALTRRNSRSGRPVQRTAPASSPCPARWRGSSAGDSSSSACSGRPISVEGAVAAVPGGAKSCCARRLWPVMRPAASSASR